MLFDSEIITEFFSFRRFPVNGLGPVVMSVFLLLALGLSFGLSIYFQRQLPGGLVFYAACILLAMSPSYVASREGPQAAQPSYVACNRICNLGEFSA